MKPLLAFSTRMYNKACFWSVGYISMEVSVCFVQEQNAQYAARQN